MEDEKSVRVVPFPKKCFLDSGRPCDKTCKAFVSKDDSCKILNSLESLRFLQWAKTDPKG